MYGIPVVKVVMTPEAIEAGINLPSRSKPSDAGFDLYALETIRLGYGQKKLIGTGARFIIPVGWYGKLFDRSSKAMEGLAITAGVIDQGYTGEVKVLVTNLTGHVAVIEQNTRFAQIVFMPYYTGALELIEETDIPTTDRNGDGFGSTGNK